MFKKIGIGLIVAAIVAAVGVGAVLAQEPTSADETPVEAHGPGGGRGGRGRRGGLRGEHGEVIAEALGMEAEGAMWRRRAAAIVRRMITDFWDEEAGLFWALRDEQPIRVVTPFNLYPLWTGQLPVPIRDRLLTHLTNPEMFWGENVIPSVARNDSHFDPQTMWRGPVWVNINNFFVEALRQIGAHDLAKNLLEKTLELVMRQSSIHEYYDAETGEPPATAADTFGWTAAVFIDLAIQASHEEDLNTGGGSYDGVGPEGQKPMQ